MQYLLLRASQRLRAIKGLYYHIQALRRAAHRSQAADYDGIERNVERMMCIVRENTIIGLWTGHFE